MSAADDLTTLTAEELRALVREQRVRLAEMQRRKARLREDEQRHRLALRLAGLGVWDWDVPRGAIHWSEEMAAIMGYRPGEFGGTLEEVARPIHPDDLPGWREATRASLEEGVEHRMELRIVLPDGRVRWIAVLGDAVRDDAGRVSRLVGVVMDITERKEAEQALRRSEELLDATGAMARVGGWEIDLDRNTVQWTRATKAIHEVPEDYLPTVEQAIDYFPDDAREVIAEAVRRARELGEPYDLVVPFVTARGRRLWTRTLGRAVFEDGVCRRVHGTFQDITEQHEAEQQLRELSRSLERRVAARTAELEAANRELESFAYSVSHDLRAPLRAISGFAQIIASRHRADLNPQGRHYFDNIVEASESMERLIEDLLRYSRLGRKGLELGPVEVSEAVQRALEPLQERVRACGAEVQVDPVLPVVQGNATLLEQIFLNLVDNALHYRREGVTPRVRVNGTLQGGQAVIDVSDNGEGIDDRFHEKIFHVFQRLHPEETHAGTGIGLAIVAKAAALMDGRVWVDSEVGRGSTFHVALQPGGPGGAGGARSR